MTSDVCVLGGTGYLGSLLTSELARRGTQVTTISRSAQANYAVDLRNEAELRKHIRQGQFRVIVNLAGSGVDSVNRDKSSMEYLNAQLPSILVDLVSDESPESSVLHVASATEPVPGRVPESEYSETKQRGTETFKVHCTNPDLSLAIAIIHNVYGPHQPPTRFVQSAIRSLASHRDFNVHFPQRIRDFVHEKEATDWLSRWVESPESAPPIFEIGTGVGTTLAEVLNLIRTELTGANAPSLELESNHFDPNPSVVAKNSPGDFGWCGLSVRHGIRQTIRAVKQ